MNNWFSFTDNEKYEVIRYTADKMVFSDVVIEKDWWVCMVLRAVFQSKYREHIVFKGGTSLSKAYNIIERFSEDVDLIIDRYFLGFEDAASKTQIKKLRKNAGTFVINDFRKELILQLQNLGISDKTFSIEYNENVDDTSDPNQLELYYHSVVPSQNHIQKKIVIEMGARALSEPSEIRKINSYIDQNFKDRDFTFTDFEVNVIVPTKTFLEKIFLLHEEFTKPTEKIRFDKLSRHLYDLEKITHTAYAENALNDNELFQTIADFRKVMNNVKGISFENHEKGKINIIPPDEVLYKWENDYKLMQQNMIVGDSLSFSELIEKIKALQNRINGNM